MMRLAIKQHGNTVSTYSCKEIVAVGSVITWIDTAGGRHTIEWDANRVCWRMDGKMLFSSWTLC